MRSKMSNHIKRRWIISAVSLAMFTMSLSVSAENKNYTFVAGDYKLEKADTGKTKIVMLDAGYSDIQSPGDPSIPQKIIEIKVPADVDLSDLGLSIVNIEKTKLDGEFDIIPQSPRYNGTMEDWGSDKNIVDGKNMNVYGKDVVYPRECVRLLSWIINKDLDTTNTAGHPTYKLMKHIRIAFMPFQYNPVEKTLIFMSKASITLSYNNKLNGINLKSLPSFAGAPEIDAGDTDYVIITTNATVAGSKRLADFVRMKTRQGHTVKVVTETDFNGLAGQAPNGRAEKIREWLKNNYLAMNINYVCLIGNPDPEDPLSPGDFVGDIPMKMCYPRFYEPSTRESPTDFFYADLVGNWDIDGDGIYGVDDSLVRALSPDPAIASTTFSARWAGEINSDSTEPYKFSAFFDDSVRVWVDGRLIIDSRSNNQPKDTTTDTMTLTAGHHSITVEYSQNTGHAVVKLYWQTPGNDKRFRDHSGIPSDHLFYIDPASGSYVSGGLNVTYYNNMNFTGTSKDTIDSKIDHIWSTGDNDPTNGRQTGSQVWVGRIPVYNNNYSSLDSILDKTIQYESADPSSIAWRKSILLPMKPSDINTPGINLGEGVKDKIAIPNSFSYFRIYDSNYVYKGSPVNPEATPCEIDTVQKYWKNGFGMVTWWTHGGDDGASGIFHSDSARNLNNTIPSFTFQASCQNGHPENSRNLGYALLKRGAVATVSASRNSWYGGGLDSVDQPHNAINECISYAYTRHVIDAGLPAGGAVSAFKADLPKVEMNAMDYNLYGDPDCYLLTTFHNQAPEADLGGPYSVDQGGTINLDASGSSDPEGDALQYRWDLDNDGAYEIPWTSSPYYSISKCEVYHAPVTVQVKDSLGLTNEATAEITFRNVNPTVEAGNNQTVNEGDLVAFNGSFTDPGCDPFSYSWTYGDMSGHIGTLNPSHNYGDNGDYLVTLRVDDGTGYGTDTLHVLVKNVAPTAHFDTIIQPSPLFILTGQTLTFKGSFTDPGWFDTHTSSWDFGDGTSDTGTLTEEHIQPDATGSTQVNKIYTKPGVFTITLTIRDDDGEESKVSKQITVLGNLHTTGSIVVGDRSKVYSPYVFGGTYAELGSLGLFKTTTLMVAGNAYLRSRGTVDGNVEVSTTCRKQDSSVVVTGYIHQGVPYTVTAIPTKTVSVGTKDTIVNNGQTATLSAGTYRDCIVRARSTLTITSGTYNFRSFTLEPGSTVIMNTSSGPIYINVNGQLNFGDRSTQIINPDPNMVSYYTNYNGNISVGTNNQIMSGAIIAPNATVNVYSGTNVKGVICTKVLRLEPDCTLDCGL